MICCLEGALIDRAAGFILARTIDQIALLVLLRRLYSLGLPLILAIWVESVIEDERSNIMVTLV